MMNHHVKILLEMMNPHEKIHHVKTLRRVMNNPLHAMMKMVSTIALVSLIVVNENENQNVNQLMAHLL
jgi:hypothetical protein